MFPACSTGFPTIGTSSEMTNPAYLQFNPVQQVVACCGLDMGMNAPDMALRRTISTPASIPETYLDTSCFTVIASSLLCFNALLSISSNFVSLYKLDQTCIACSNSSLLQPGMLKYKTFSIWSSIKEDQYPFHPNHLQVDRASN